ncbi:MAG: ribonuclease HII [Methanobacteriota archaeon]|nr:MAG: ribonuclease HII [Euryarchaeota archaeon]
MNFPTYDIEESVKFKGFEYVAGVDEAGRGPGAGPVVAAAAVIPEDVIPDLLLKVNDSKKLTAKKREALYPLIMDKCDVGVGLISSDTIDDINILQATKLAMKEALGNLNKLDYAIIDGTVVLNDLWVPQDQVVKGDNKSISVAAASIIAKVVRDKVMIDLHDIFPIYGWDTNKGYLTKKHVEAIETYGITEFHRVSFRKVGR